MSSGGAGGGPVGAADRTWSIATVVLLGVCAAGAILRVATLDVQSLWYDEAVTAQRVIYPSFSETIAWIWDHENHPPLWYVVEWAWTRIAGIGEFAFRLPAAIAGVMMIPVGYLIGRELDSPRAGLVLAALVAVQPLLFWFSQEARPYSLYALLAALSFWAFIRASRSGSTWDLMLWAVLSALALLTHYFAAFPVAVEGAWLLFTHRRLRRAWLAVGGVGLLTAGLIPVVSRAQEFTSNDWIADADFGERLYFVLSSPFNGLVRDHRPLAASTVALASLLLAYGISRTDPSRRRAYALCLVVAAGAVLLPLGITAIGTDYFLQRNVIAWIVPLLGAFAVAIARLPHLAAMAATVVLICVSAIPVITVFAEPEERRRDWRSAIAHLRSMPEPPQVVAGGDLSWGSLDYYLGGREIAAAHVTATRVALAGWPETRPEWLPKSFRKIERRQFDGGLQVRIYGSEARVRIRIPTSERRTSGSFYALGDGR